MSITINGEEPKATKYRVWRKFLCQSDSCLYVDTDSLEKAKAIDSALDSYDRYLEGIELITDDHSIVGGIQQYFAEYGGWEDYTDDEEN